MSIQATRLALSEALFAEAGERGVDLLKVAEGVGCAPYALTDPDGMRSLNINELKALCEALGVPVVDVMRRAWPWPVGH